MFELKCGCVSNFDERKFMPRIRIRNKSHYENVYVVNLVLSFSLDFAVCIARSNAFMLWHNVINSREYFA